MEEEKKEMIEKQEVEQTEDTQKIVETKQTTQEQSKEKDKKDKKGFSITSMVLGIIALVFFCLWYISIPCGILAIIFGVLSVKSSNKGMSIAGIITGAIGLFICFFIIVIFFIYGIATGISDALNDDYDRSYRNYNHHNWDWYDYD